VKRLTPLPRKRRRSLPLSSRRRKLTSKREKLPSLLKLRLTPLRLLNWRALLRRQLKKSLRLKRRSSIKLLRSILLSPKEKSSRLLSRLSLSPKNLKFKNRLTITPPISLPTKRMLRLTLLRERKLSPKRPLPELN